MRCGDARCSSEQVAGRTNDAAGDGTTTACVLAAELIKYGIQVVTSGANPVYVKKGIDKTCTFLLEKLKANARPVSGFEDIKSVASISAGNDEFIGNLIAEALDKVGADGVLSIESSQSTETSVEVQEGMQIDRGFISPQFVNNPERQVCEFDNCRVLVADHKVKPSPNPRKPSLPVIPALNSKKTRLNRQWREAVPFLFATTYRYKADVWVSWTGSDGVW